MILSRGAGGPGYLPGNSRKIRTSALSRALFRFVKWQIRTLPAAAGVAVSACRRLLSSLTLLAHSLPRGRASRETAGADKTRLRSIGPASREFPGYPALSELCGRICDAKVLRVVAAPR